MRLSIPGARLVKATPLLALLAPLVIFGFLHVLIVQPERAAAQAAHDQALILRDELTRGRAVVRLSPPEVTEALAKQEFDRRTPEKDKAADVAGAITSLANSPAIGGVTNLSIEMGTADGTPVDPRIDLFRTPVAYTPVVLAFDAQYAQIGRFFSNLRTLPATFELRSVELAPARPPLMRARIVLFVFKRGMAATPVPAPAAAVQSVDVSPAPEWHSGPFTVQPEAAKVPAGTTARPRDPVVESILFSDSRRVALVDGRAVKAGDRVGSELVRAIDEDGVVLSNSAGLTKRIRLNRPTIRTVR